ncbi:MAG: radical SAM protein, partial [bacterium]
VPMLASVGCPYDCDFCVDWNSEYISMPSDRLEADLRYLPRNHPGILIAYADPNFGVKFDQTMDAIEKIPKERRNPYIMESSLSILTESRLNRLRETNCIYVAPGVESWSNYSNKAGSGTKTGREKMEQIVGHFNRLRRYVTGLQANFVFGTDVDRGREPVELTKEFVRRLPFVWPALNIPTPLGGTPLYDKYFADGRILKAMPFYFYFSQTTLVTTLKNYHPVEYYDHLIDISREIASARIFTRRMLGGEPPSIRFLHSLRALIVRKEIAEFRRIREMIAGGGQFRAFHEGRSETLPEYYHHQFEKKLGPYADLISREERTPRLEEVRLKVVDGAERKKEEVFLKIT